MKKFVSHAAGAILALVFIFGATLDSIHADTSNLSVSTPGVVLLPVHLTGDHDTDVTAAVQIKLPFPAKVLGVSASARASSGTKPTLTVDVLDDGTSILSEPIPITASQVTEGLVTSAVIADESVITVNLAIGGASASWDDIDVLLTLARL